MSVLSGVRSGIAAAEALFPKKIKTFLKKAKINLSSAIARQPDAATRPIKRFQARRVVKPSKANINDVASYSASPKGPSPSGILPSLHVGFDKHNAPVVSLARAAPPIRQLVLQGGGAKGVVYPSFVKEMDRKSPGFLAALDDVAGSSAGASMAFLLAAGVSLDEMERFAQNTNLLTLMGGSKSGVTSRIRLGRDGLLPALALRKTLHEMSIQPAAAYYKESIAHDPQLKSRIRAQYGGASFLSRANGGFSNGLTFNDLRLLHSLKPEQFKLLHVTAYDKNRAQTYYFDGDNPKTRNIPCFEAVGASMAIPLVFRSVKIKLEGEKTSRRFVDGGIGSNAPVEIFRRKNQAETMLLHFESDGQARQILHDRAIPVSECKAFSLKLMAGKVAKAFQKQINFLLNKPEAPLAKRSTRKRHAPKWHGPKPPLIQRLVAGKNYSENVRRDGMKIHNLAINAVVVPHGDIDTLSFAASTNRKIRAVNTAKKAASCYVDAVRLGSGAQKEYADIDTAIASLSREEIHQLKSVADAKIAAGEKLLQQLLLEPNRGVARIDRQIQRNQLELRFYNTIKNA